MEERNRSDRLTAGPDFFYPFDDMSSESRDVPALGLAHHADLCARLAALPEDYDGE